MSTTTKILVADDDQDMLDMLDSLLTKAGYTVIRAENGLEAVEKTRKELPALVMLDIHMPEMDGLKACKEIKSSQFTKSVPVIMLTIKGSMSQIQRAISYGAKTYLTKPASPEEILKVVKSILS
ncbi:MAG TPA: two-component system response regulator [Elusimicrobia bacterium]|nr:two-component system response regulator [Elusimicrobiota bacterium]